MLSARRFAGYRLVEVRRWWGDIERELLLVQGGMNPHSAERHYAQLRYSNGSFAVVCLDPSPGWNCAVVQIARSVPVGSRRVYCWSQSGAISGCHSGVQLIAGGSTRADRGAP